MMPTDTGGTHNSQRGEPTMTMQYFANKISEGRYGLAVVEEHNRGIIATLLRDSCITEVTDVEEYFNFSKLADDEYLVRFGTWNGAHWYQIVYEDGLQNWIPME